MVLELHVDLLSQPARTIYLFMKVANVDFELHKVSLLTGDHMKPEYMKINPLHKVPVIIDDGFILTESVAQLRYVSNKNNVAEHWYPRRDLQLQARVDEFLNWHHTGLRKQCIELFLTTFRSKVGVGRFTKIPYDADKIKELKEAAMKSVKEIDECFLKGKQYIVSNDISVADIAAYNELLQLTVISQDDVFNSNPNTKAWMQRIEAKLGTALIEEARAVLKMMKDKYESS